MLRFRFAEAENGLALSCALARRLSIAEAGARRLVKDGRVRLCAEKAGECTVYAGDIAEVYVPEKLADCIPVPEVIYEDANIMIVNKRAGIESEGRPKRTTMLTMAAQYMKNAGQYDAKEGREPSLPLPLETDVGGLMMIAKNSAADVDIRDGLRERRISVRWLAVLAGKLEQVHGELHDYIELDRRVPRISAAPGAGAEHMVTRYTLLAETDEFSLVEAEPITFVDWQVRMHFSYNGTPVLGDLTLGDAARSKQLGVWEAAMFVQRIAFNGGRTSPLAYLNGRSFEAEAPLPDVGEWREVW